MKFSPWGLFSALHSLICFMGGGEGEEGEGMTLLLNWILTSGGALLPLLAQKHVELICAEQIDNKPKRTRT